MPGNARSMPVNGRLIRPLAILLMVLGAAGFAAARVMFGEQVLCMFGSTAVVFLGLGLIIYARKNAPPQPAAAEWQEMQEPAPFLVPVEVEPHHNHAAALTDFVIDNLQQQGAQVVVETRRPERSIVRITTPAGEAQIAMIDEGTGAVDVTQLRALMALVANDNSQRGYYVTDGYFTPRAAAWAAGKPLRLVEKGQFESLLIG